MVRSMKSLFGFDILAQDGEIGTVHDFYFEHKNWMTRWLVASTGSWLTRKRVLLSLLALGVPDWENKKFPVQYTRAQVKASPDIDTDRPMSRKEEISLHQHYDLPVDWGVPPSGEVSLLGPQPPFTADIDSSDRLPGDRYPPTSERWGDPELQSARAVIGYRIKATDGDIGQVEDLLTDGSWRIRYLVVDPGAWLPDRKLVLSPEWIDQVHSPQKELVMDLSLEQVRTSPTYDPGKAFDRPQEAELYEHYRRKGYWS